VQTIFKIRKLQTAISFRGSTRGAPIEQFRNRIRAQSERVWNEVERLRIIYSGLESSLLAQPPSSDTLSLFSLSDWAGKTRIGFQTRVTRPADTPRSGYQT
jgi:hypothetical protein